jgi:general secretion pathway protein G
MSPGINKIYYDIYTLGADGLEGGVGEDADIGNWNVNSK